MTLSGAEWLERFAGELGVDAPSEREIEALLGLAAIAAHASERTAAPVACWLVARAGVSLPRALEIAASMGVAGAPGSAQPGSGSGA